MTDDELLALCRSQEYHYDCEDCWYSCPKSGNCCNDTVGDDCTCGYDRRVKEKMTLYKAGYRAAMVEVWERRSAVVAACPELEDALYCFNLWVHEQVQKAGE